MPRPRRIYSSHLKILLLIKHLVGIGAVVTVVSPSKTPPSLTLTSSTFLYYGPQDGFEVTAPALYLGRMEACNPSRAKVAGKIVVSILDDSACRMESTYATLSALGAVGHVNIVPWNPPGTRTFRHHSWNACEYCNSLMPWLTVPSGAADLETWTNPSLVLSIGGHHDKSYENLYLSPLWTGLLRVFAPFLALDSAVLATFGLTVHTRALKIKLSSHSSCLGERDLFNVICTVEAISMTVVAVILACGQFGPMMLPYAFHIAFTDLMMGFSVVTTLLIAIFLHDEVNAVRRARSRQAAVPTLWSKHYQTVTLVTVLILFASLSQLGFMWLPGWWGIGILVIFVAIYLPLQVGIAVFFLYNLWIFRDAVYCYLHPNAASSATGNCAPSYRRLGRFIFWVSVSSACMVINIGAMAFLLFATSRSIDQTQNLDAIFISLVVMVLSRIGLSHAQVRCNLYFQRAAPFNVSASPMMASRHGTFLVCTSTPTAPLVSVL